MMITKELLYEMIDVLPVESHERVFKFLKGVLGNDYHESLSAGEKNNLSTDSGLLPDLHKMLQEQLDAISGYMKKEFSATFRQTEALASLFAVLNIVHPLPSMTGMAVTPDFARILVDKILELKPKIIVETGSGVSTLISAYACKKNGCGKIYSLEHHQHFAAESTKNIALHGLQDYAKIIYAPLQKTIIAGKQWLWYDTSKISASFQRIDMLIVDGPPADVQKESRYPAIPLLEHLFSDQICVIADDTLRNSEGKVLSRWLQEYAFLQEEKIFCEKGASLLTRYS